MNIEHDCIFAECSHNRPRYCQIHFNWLIEKFKKQERQKLDELEEWAKREGDKLARENSIMNVDGKADKKSVRKQSDNQKQLQIYTKFISKIQELRGDKK